MDIDRIQRELDATESFLRTRGQDVSTSSLRTSQQKSSSLDVPPPVDSFWMESSSAAVITDKKESNEEVEETAAFGRYANPMERERLISRLLKEHNLKSGGPESTDTSRDADGDDRNTLFFASDLHHPNRIIPGISHDSSYPSGMTMKDRLVKELPEEYEEYSIPYSSAEVGEDSDTFDRLSSGGNASFVGGGRGMSQNNSSTTMGTRTRPLSAPPRTRGTDQDPHTFDMINADYFSSLLYIKLLSVISFPSTYPLFCHSFLPSLYDLTLDPDSTFDMIDVDNSSSLLYKPTLSDISSNLHPMTSP